MAAYDVHENPETGKLTLQVAWSFRLFAVIVGIVGFIGLTAGLYGIGGAGSTILGLIFSPIALYLLFYQDTTIVEPSSRLLKKIKGLPPFSTTTLLPFDQLANFAVENYLVRLGNATRDAWRVQAIERAGNIFVMSNGGRAEMLELGQKISAMTGAPLLDHSEKRDA